MRTIAFILRACAVMCAPAAAIGQAQAPGAATSEPVLVSGELTVELVDSFATTLASRPDARELIINSPGGNVDAAIRLARLVRERHLEVKVRRVCGSVCALFVIPAASRVTFEGDAVPLFGQMVSPQWFTLLGQQESQPGLSEEERARSSQLRAVMRRLLVDQDRFFRAIGADPTRIYRLMNIWMETNRILRASERTTENVGIVPDLRFFEQCLGLTNMDWRALTVADSARLAHIGRTPLAFVVGGKLYYEGVEVPMDGLECESPSRDGA